MAEVFHLDLHITDDMTTSQEADAIKQLARAAQMIGAISMMRNKHTIATQPMQALLNGAAHLEGSAAIWDGRSPLAIPQMMTTPRPI